MQSFIRWSGVLVVLAMSSAAAPGDEPYRIERIVALSGTEKYLYTQSRATVIPGDTGDRVMIVSQETEKEGSHGYRDLMAIESADRGKTWSSAMRIESLRRKKFPGGDELAIGDVTPAWHAATKTVLATGKTFTFRGGTTEDRLAEQVSYAVYTPGSSGEPLNGTWTELRTLKLPEKDKGDYALVSPNSGCAQRVDLPDGEVLLPVRYRRNGGQRDYTAMVARCKFDGRTLTYIEHGSELWHNNGGGFGEPSLAKFGNRYFLTLRNDATGYVTSGDDGLNFAKPIEWCYDDGTPIGTYQTQQHWVAHVTHGLYLVYTRRGAENDYVFRNRAPLFIAKVDPIKLRLIRATEQVLMPLGHADLGNFGVAVVSPTETWVVSAESLLAEYRKTELNKVIVAKILWTSPAGGGGR